MRDDGCSGGKCKLSRETLPSRQTILLLDDNEAFLKQFAPILSREGGYSVVPFSSSSGALEFLDGAPVNLIISDICMPEMTGIEFFRKVRDVYPHIPVIFITAFGSTENAVDLVKQGAYHYFEKPFTDKLDLFLSTIREAVAKSRMLKRLAAVESARALQGTMSVPLIGQSRAIEEVLQSARDVADLPVSVLIQGETGTGKELVARFIYETGNRKEEIFFPVNCGAFTEGLLESELFGHERGAFTGALVRKRGLFEVTDRGTLFLDEISEASHAVQTKLLRVLETKTFTRVGGTVPVASDFRVIAATNRNLEKMAAEGKFRHDLLYRLNVYIIEVPPLRERREDIPLLAEFYLQKFSKQYRREIDGFSADGALFLIENSWPGNVRELINVIERAVIGCRSGVITAGHLASPVRGRQDEDGMAPVMSLKDGERFLIQRALDRCRGNRGRAAELLGINRKTLGEKIKIYGIRDKEVD